MTCTDQSNTWEHSSPILVRTRTTDYIEDLRYISVKDRVIFDRVMITLIPSFRYRDNSVHLHECSPVWVGIYITFNKELNLPCLLFCVDMCILIDKALKQYNML